MRVGGRKRKRKTQRSQREERGERPSFSLREESLKNAEGLRKRLSCSRSPGWPWARCLPEIGMNGRGSCQTPPPTPRSASAGEDLRISIFRSPARFSVCERRQPGSEVATLPPSLAACQIPNRQPPDIPDGSRKLRTKRDE